MPMKYKENYNSVNDKQFSFHVMDFIRANNTQRLIFYWQTISK